MIYFKLTTAFKAEPSNLYTMVFGQAVHSFSRVNPDEGVFVYGFTDETVTPADLGPLVRVERVTDLSILP